jgi:uncharacterized repeat protein (TIGR01451 family)
LYDQTDVTSNTPGVYTNLIPARSLQSRQGVPNASAASAPLNVQSIGVEKEFSLSTFLVGGKTLLVITLQNPTLTDYTGAAFTDTLPVGLSIASPSEAATTCAGGVGQTDASSVSLSGGRFSGGRFSRRTV